MIRRRAPVALLCALCSLLGGITSANAQTPNQAGALPYIVIIMDTSSSTEYTAKGINQFPDHIGNAFRPGLNMGIVDNSGNLTNWPASDPKAYLGPCAVWAPNTCAEYERPSRFYGNGHFGPDVSTSTAGWGDMHSRMKKIRDNLSYRLTDENQPKHITIKEILTGDMIFSPDGTADPDALNASDYGPGCWFVPRQAKTKAQPEIAKYCATAGAFTKYNDVTEPVPHIQEVYNYQRKNGLLDSLSRSAIFAFAGLDGFKEPGLYDDPYVTYPSAEYPSGRMAKREDSSLCPGGSPCTNLGVTRIVSPSRLKGLTLSELSSASEYTQQAILDSGYLHKPGTTPPLLKITGSDPQQHYQFQPTDARFLSDMTLGGQPIARATPLAGAVYDVGNFFALASTDTSNPLHESNDPYTQCRDRHVIIISDGSPAPELPNPDINVSVGSAQLSAAYGYDPDYFPYETTPKEISFVNQYRPPLGHNVKVHVVALLDELPVPAPAKDLQERQARLRILDSMAFSGGTCASGNLSADWISADPAHPEQCPRNGGAAANLGRACLDISDRGSYATPSNPAQVRPHYTFLNKNGVREACEYPALVLTKNTRADVEAALSETFNNIIEEAGVRSRTRTVYSEDLQKVSDCSGTLLNMTGVNEFLSGVKTGGGPTWAGLLYRNSYPCGCSPQQQCSAGTQPPPTPTNFSEQISAQVQKTGTSYEDDRRVYTTYLSPSLYNYSNLGTGNSYRNLPSSEPDRFFMPWVPYEHSSGTSFAGATFGAPRNFKDSFPGKSGTTQFELERSFMEALGLFGPLGSHSTLENISQFLGLPAQSKRAVIDEVFNKLRGRSLEKEGRVLGGIYNGNPVTLDPPSLDVPIESYRLFKKQHEKRPPMVFVPTVDGLLHAIYGGEGEALNATASTTEGVIRHRQFRKADGPIVNNLQGETAVTSAQSQREAWAYLPFSLLSQLATTQTSNPYLLDGTPSIKDVRLCNANAAYNQNVVACGTKTVPGPDQWRTALVQGMGLAGKGYFALDVTFQGGRANPAKPSESYLPDPITLWEFVPANERIQANHLYSKKVGEKVIGSSKSPCSLPAEEVWNRSLMGNSISDPEIGTLLINAPDNTGRLQRPVVLFGGGEADPSETPVCGGTGGNLSGKGIYIMDLQTGSILRRFVSYYSNSTEHLFPSPITGSPVLYSNFTGSLATRGFIGDAQGRLYKIDLTSSNPEDWKVYLFFDPAANKDWFSSTLEVDPVTKKPIFGPANYKPAITKMHDENLLVVYGLGEVGDRISPTSHQAVIALRDRIGLDPNKLPVKDDTDPLLDDMLWNVLFKKREKMTGAPFIFNNTVYFPTFVAPDESNLCIVGEPKINRVDADGTIHVTEFDKTKEATVIRGLSLRINPCCSGGDTPPELVAQTGGSDLSQKGSGSSSSQGGAAGAGPAAGEAVRTGELSTFRQNIQNPTSQSIPLSWTRIIN